MEPPLTPPPLREEKRDTVTEKEKVRVTSYNKSTCKNDLTIKRNDHTQHTCTNILTADFMYPNQVFQVQKHK
jgi:hypothetical protein